METERRRGGHLGRRKLMSEVGDEDSACRIRSDVHTPQGSEPPVMRRCLGQHGQTGTMWSRENAPVFTMP
jgi:hypothetical protein